MFKRVFAVRSQLGDSDFPALRSIWPGLLAKRFEIGERIAIAYLGAFFFFPMIASGILDLGSSSDYKVFPPTAFAAIYLVVILALALVTGRLLKWCIEAPGLRSRRSRLEAFSAVVLRVYAGKRFYLSILAFLFSAYFIVSGRSVYRYTDTSISQASSPAILAGMVINAFLTAELFFRMFCLRGQALEGERHSGRATLLSACSVLFLSGGVADLLRAFYCLFFAAAPAAFDRLFFQRKSSLKERMLGQARFLAVLVALFGASWVWGNAIKAQTGQPPAVVMSTEPEAAPRYREVTFWFLSFKVDEERAAVRRQNFWQRLWHPFTPILGVKALTPVEVKREGKRWWLRLRDTMENQLSSAMEQLPRIFSTSFLPYLIERISVYYHSFMYTMNVSRADLARGEPTALSYPMATLIYRADYLTGGFGGVKRPEISSVCQLNYVNLAKEPTNTRSGSCPGLIASLHYLGGVVGSVPFLILYLGVLCVFLGSVVRESPLERMSFLPVLVILHFTQDLFNSPIDYALIFDGSVIWVATLLLFWLNRPQTAVGNERPLAPSR